MKIGCIVLAAGHSKRFGAEEKLLSDLGGRPLAQYILEAIPKNAFSGIVVVVTNENVKALCAEIGLTYIQYEGGQLSDSIRHGLCSLSDDLDGYMFINADRPFLRGRTISRMVERFCEYPEAAVRLYWNNIPSNPILFPRSARETLMTLSGDKGGSSLLKSGKYRVEAVCAEDEIETWDADTPEALEKMRTMLTQRRQELVHNR